MEEQKIQTENEKNNNEIALKKEEIVKKKIDFNKLFPKQAKIDRLQVKQRFAFTHGGKTKKG
jgi:hypothetical protein